MVNIRASSPTPEGTSGTCNVNAMAEMRAAMDELQRHNRTLEDDLQNFKKCQEDVNPSDEVELLYP